MTNNNAMPKSNANCGDITYSGENWYFAVTSRISGGESF